MSLYEHLMPNGFAPLTVVPTSDAALDLFYRVCPRLVLVDLHLPDHDVIDLCTEMLLAQPAIKVVLVAKPEAEPPLAALHAGISGCIKRDLPLTAWPGLLTYILGGGRVFHRGVFEAALAAAKSAQEGVPMMTVGPLQIDLAQHQVLYGGRRVLVTPREFALLACLVRNLDRAVPIDQLLNEAWGYDANTGTPAQVRVFIARLRRKLLEGVQAPDFILTERGVGYRLHSEVLRKANIRAERRMLPPL